MFHTPPPVQRSKEHHVIGRRMDSTTSDTATVNEENDVFEIVDHTVASEWEGFIAAVEGILRVWSSSSTTSPVTSERQRRYHTTNDDDDDDIPLESHIVDSGDGGRYRIALYDFSYVAMKDAKNASKVSTLNDVLLIGNLNHHHQHHYEDNSSSESISRRYGVQRFVIVTSVATDIPTRCEAKIVLSSMILAATAASFVLPIFVRRAGMLYEGRAVTAEGVTVHFDMARIRHTPEVYATLSGLIGLFRSKIGDGICQESNNRNDISAQLIVSASLTYVIDGDALLKCANIKSNRSENSRPLCSIGVCADWSDYPEDRLSDNAVYSELVPMRALMWRLDARFSERLMNCPLVDSVHVLWETIQCVGDMDMDKLLAVVDETGSEAARQERNRGRHALRALTKSNAPLTTLGVAAGMDALTSMVATSVEKTVASVAAVASIENDIATEEEVSIAIGSIIESCRLKPEKQTPPLRGLKAAPRGSLTQLLVRNLIYFNSERGGLRAVGLWWSELVRRIRWHWENVTLLPYVDYISGPDLSASLLHQKFQLLNCCIDRKLSFLGQRSRCCYTPNSPMKAQTSELNVCSDMVDDDRDDDNDNEFVDAFEHQPGSPTESASIDTVATDLACGIIGRHHTMKLLMKNTPLCIPMTQEAGFMSEDMIAEQQEVFSRLGTSEEAGRIRARMQAASLLSDMEAFKAANPSCCLGDFVRWHSPRDWLPGDGSDENVNGELSARMVEEGNLWQECWSVAQSVPVSLQRPIFDFSREAEKILHYIETESPAQLLSQMLPIAYDSTYSELIPTNDGHGSSASPRWMSIAPYQSACNDLAATIIHAEVSDIGHEVIMDRIREVETLAFVTRDIFNVVNGDSFLASTLITDLAVSLSPSIPGHEAIICRLLDVLTTYRCHDINNVSVDINPKPTIKEFILCSPAALPSPTSRGSLLAQRMYAKITTDEFQVAGAFSRDSTYF